MIAELEKYTLNNISELPRLIRHGPEPYINCKQHSVVAYRTPQIFA